MRGRYATSGPRLSGPGSLIYILVEEAVLSLPQNGGLRCAGAITLSRGADFTFCFFPSIPRAVSSLPEVDHLTAHFDLEQGKLQVSEVHAKARRGEDILPRVNVPLENIRKDEGHFAFEYWVRDIPLLDPAGAVTSRVGPIWNEPIDLQRLNDRIRDAQPRTFACSAPSVNGLIPPGVSLVLRVGVLTEIARAEAGGTEMAVSKPYVGRYDNFRSSIHRYRNTQNLRPDWQEDVSVFVEVGFLRRLPTRDYVLPDLRGTTFEEMVGAD
jgi:hypothetical protein